MNINQLHKDTFDASIASGTVLVDFWAPWCGYCRRITPAVEALAGELAGKLTVAGVNIDDDGPLGDRYGVDTIPSLLLFRDGKQVGQALVAPGSKAQITDWLAENGAV